MTTRRHVCARCRRGFLAKTTLIHAKEPAEFVIRVEVNCKRCGAVNEIDLVSESLKAKRKSKKYLA